MTIQTYDLNFCDNKAEVMIAKGAQILSVGVRKDFRLGRFFEVPFLVVKADGENETEKLSVKIIPVLTPIEAKAWHYYLGTIALDNGTSSYNVIAIAE